MWNINIFGENKSNFAFAFMKRFFVFILTLAYIASSSGATIYIHQCMGKTIAWDIIENEGNSCSKCGMHKNAAGDCCNDHVKVLKIHNDHNLPVANYSKVLVPAILPTPGDAFLQPSLFDAENKTIKSFTPLRSSTKSYCILYC